MTTLFPSFTSIWQRAKRLMAKDTREIWRQICEVIEADEERYIRDCRDKGIEFLI